MKTDLSKTLEQLENKKWGEPGYPSYLVTTIHSLRKKPLQDYTIEDLRISIGQNCSLEYLIPIALEKLQENILAEGHFYEGDLLKNVLDSDIEFWKTHRSEWLMMKDIFTRNSKLFDTDENRSFRKYFEKFETIHHDKY